MDGYPPIEDHGLIGDLQTAALITSDATIDWFCAPRFDSPSIFAGLLDPEKGGSFEVRPIGVEYVTRQLYLPDTCILMTRFMSSDGVGEVIDFMPIAGNVATDRHRLVRMIRVVRGEMTFEAICDPRFNYGRDSHEVTITEDGAVFRSPTMTVNLNAARHGAPLVTGGLTRHGEGGIRAVAHLHAGDVGGTVLETAPGGPPTAVTPEAIQRMYEETREYWRRWISKSQYTGRWRANVERSAMTLKLMTYAPTGALVAAPTAGLPEQVGGERNWDYRFTWVRDASFSVYALLGLGFTEEAEAFLRWLGDRVEDAGMKGTRLQIMYRVDGSADLHEEELDHLAGYKGSRPVRIGNGAMDQLQLDIYGEAMDSVRLADSRGLRMGSEGWQHLAEMMDWLSDNWDQPDDGIWETRGGRQDFTYGRLMEWVAFDRALRLADTHGLPADVVKWRDARNAIYKQIMERGYNREREAFVQHYETNVLDASLLYMPLLGFISPRDPMWLSTLAAMDAELVSDSLVYRYDPGASPDGLLGSEGTFSMCTFWYVDALARSGRLDEAQLTFEKMLTYANRLGLFAEEIGPTGEQLGNFPQAFSHLALISAAVNLDAQLNTGRLPELAAQA